MAAASDATADALPFSSAVSSSHDEPLAEPLAALLPASPFDWRALVEPEWWDQVPADVPDLLAVLPRADLYIQDEVDIALHPTLTRCWSAKGHRGQRLVRTPGQNAKIVGFGAVDWRAGWFSYGCALGRTADPFCRQLDHLVARSRDRGRIAIVLADNLKIHTPRGSKKLRETLATHGDQLRLVYTPAYDPDANPIERLWRMFRHHVTHNHRRDQLSDLQLDAFAYWDDLDCHPDRVLRHVGSPWVNYAQAVA